MNAVTKCVEIDDYIAVPEPWASVLRDSGKFVGTTGNNGAFKMNWQQKPVVQRLVDANILPGIMNPVSLYKSKGPYSPWEHQRWMMELHVAYTAGYNLADMGCVDDQTEYLSPTGWKYIKDYDGGMVCSGIAYGQLLFEHPVAYTKAPHFGAWYRIYGDGYDQMVTGDHRVPVVLDDAGNLTSVAENWSVQALGVFPRMVSEMSADRGHMLETPRFVRAEQLYIHGGKGVALTGQVYEAYGLLGIRHTEPYDSLRGTRYDVQRVPANNGTKYCFTTSTSVWLMRRNGCVAVTGNSGKTNSALWAFDLLRDLGRVDRLLIIAPLSTVEAAWMVDKENSVPHLKAAVMIGSKKARMKYLIEDTHDILIINHDGVKIIEREIIDWAKKHKVMTVYDEATAIADYTTQRSKSAVHIFNASARRYVLTATPVVQHLMKAHGLLVAINNNPNVPRTKTAFRKEFFVDAGPHQWIPRVTSFDRIQKLMQPAIRLNTRDVVKDLPPNVVLHRWPALTADQQRAWEQMEAELVYQHDPTTVITAANAAVKLGKLLQISCGILNGSEDGPIELEPTHKYEALLEVIEESQSKVLIFTPFTASVDAIFAWLEKTFEPGCADIIDGRVAAKKRGPIMARFQDPDDKLQFLVAHPAATSHGLTLTEADTTVWFSPFMRAESFVQANQRIDRPGQKRHSRTVLLEATKMERDLFAVLLDKKATNNSFVSVYDRFILEKSASMAKQGVKR